MHSPLKIITKKSKQLLVCINKWRNGVALGLGVESVKPERKEQRQRERT